MSAKFKQALTGMEAWIEQARQEWKVPGLAIAVVGREGALYSAGFGVHEIGGTIPITPDTVFAIGSATKSFTTALLSILTEEGILAWDTPIKEYVPSFRMHDSFASERMTLRDIACHRSGLPRHELVAYRSPLTREGIMEKLRYLEPNLDFRSGWQYQNLLYIAAGHLIEAVTGTTWEQWIQDRIFKPLTMKNSNMTAEQMQKAGNRAVPHRKTEEQVTPVPFLTIDLAGPAGSINSTVSDMTNWLLLQLNGGTFQKSQIIAEQSMQEMHFPHMIVGPGEFPEILYTMYGLGWFIDIYRGRRLIHHGGNTDGFTAHVSFLPDEGIGLVILANLENTLLPDCIAYSIYDRVLGVDDVDWNRHFTKRDAEIKQWLAAIRHQVQIEQVLNTRTSHPLAEYIGHFVHPAYGEAEVVLTEEQLQLKYRSTVLSLDHYHYDTFRAIDTERDVAFLVSFFTGKEGRIDRLEMPLEHSPGVSDIVFTIQG